MEWNIWVWTGSRRKGDGGFSLHVGLGTPALLRAHPLSSANAHASMVRNRRGFGGVRAATRYRAPRKPGEKAKGMGPTGSSRRAHR